MNFSMKVQILNLCFLSHPAPPLPFFLSSSITPALTLRILNQVKHSSFSQLRRTLKKACILNKRCCMCVFFFFSLTYPHFGSQLRWKRALMNMHEVPELSVLTLAVATPFRLDPPFLFFCHCRSPSLTFRTGSLTS